MNKGLIAVLVMAGCIFCQSFAMADGDLSLYTNSGRPIKVFIGNFTNESGKDKIKGEEFKGVFEDVTLNRKSVKFVIVNDPSDSELTISGVIKQFQYLDKGPMKLTPSAWGMALDAAASATQNYVEMEVDFTVAKTKTGEVMWKGPIYDYKKKIMTHEESIPIAYNEVARLFFERSFGKPVNLSADKS